MLSIASILTILRIGTPELIIIAVIILLLFGARRIPDLMRSFGKGIREFKNASRNESPEKDKNEEEI